MDTRAVRAPKPPGRGARVFAGYVDRRRHATAPAQDAVLVRSLATLPTIVRQWQLGSLEACLFEGRDVDVTPAPNVASPRAEVSLGSRPGGRGAATGGGLVIGYVVSGVMHVAQDVRDGRRALRVAKGQIVFYDGLTPWDLRAEGAHHYFVTYVGSDALRIRGEERDAVVARDLSAHAGNDALVALLAGLVEADSDLTPGVREHLSDAIVACVLAIVADVRDLERTERPRLFEQLVQWLDAHLADGRLSAEVLAEQQYLSARYVRKLFAEHGTTVSRYVRLRRLERIRDELLHPRSVELPVSAVAARWGFHDPSVFSRAFTRQFGQGPQSFRRGLTRSPTTERVDPDGPTLDRDGTV